MQDLLMEIKESQARIEVQLTHQHSRIDAIDAILIPINHWFTFLKYTILAIITTVGISVSIKQLLAARAVSTEERAEIDIMLQMSPSSAKCGYIVTSGFRTTEENQAVGGAPNSYHLVNKARDLVLLNCTPEQFVSGLFPFISYIIYPTHIHIDLRDYPWFKYDKRKE